LIAPKARYEVPHLIVSIYNDITSLQSNIKKGNFQFALA